MYITSDSNQRPLAYQASGLTATLLTHREDNGYVETRYIYILVANIFDSQYDALHDITLYYMSVTCHITWQVTRRITWLSKLYYMSFYMLFYMILHDITWLLNWLHGIYTYNYMFYYISHYMNNYMSLHDILHEITCHYMEFVLVPTSRMRLRCQDLRLAPRRRVHAGAGRSCRGLGVHSASPSNKQSLHSIMSSVFLTELEFPPRSSHKDSCPNTG